MPKLWKPPNYKRTPLHKLFVVADVEVVDVDVLVVVAVNRFEME